MEEKYLIDFDNYVSDCRYCLNSGLNLPDEPMLKDYDPALIAERQKIEEELKQEAAAAGMTVEEYAANDFISPKQQTNEIRKTTKKQANPLTYVQQSIPGFLHIPNFLLL